MGATCIAQTTLSAGLTEDVEQLRNQIKREVVKHYQEQMKSSEISISVSQLDPRLRLALCSTPKNIKINGAHQRAANISVRISCNGDAPWSIFVPVKIDIFQEVVIATRDMFKGDVLGGADIGIEKRNITTLGFGYTQLADELIGNQVTRNIAAGSAISLSQISKPMAISRGDKVILESGRKGLVVATAVIAMGDGHVGDQIQLKNPQSNRIVEAYVVAPGRAAANL